MNWLFSMLEKKQHLHSISGCSVQTKLYLTKLVDVIQEVFDANGIKDPEKLRQLKDEHYDTKDNNCSLDL